MLAPATLIRKDTMIIHIKTLLIKTLLIKTLLIKTLLIKTLRKTLLKMTSLITDFTYKGLFLYEIIIHVMIHLLML